jgi:hypothetical protein
MGHVAGGFSGHLVSLRSDRLEPLGEQIGGRIADAVLRRGCRLEVARKRGPKTDHSDEKLTALIRVDLESSPFVGEGHRKVWARLRLAGVRTSLRRVLGLVREAGLLAPSR